jgi:hypothetical protein
MGEFHPFHWFVVFGFLACIAIPVGNILKRTGHKPVWCVFCFLPVVSFALLWVFAFKPWPTDSKPQSA